MKKATAPWVRKAEADYQLAKQTARGKGKFHDAVCFHCQQCVEKYLKARLIEGDVAFPKIHVLDRLLDLAITLEPEWKRHYKKCAALTDFAVDQLNDFDDAFDAIAAVASAPVAPRTATASNARLDGRTLTTSS